MSQGKFLKMMALLLGLCGVAAAIVIPLILIKRNSSVATSTTSTASMLFFSKRNYLERFLSKNKIVNEEGFVQL